VQADFFKIRTKFFHPYYTPPVRMGVCNTPLQDGYSRCAPPVRMGVCNTPLQDGYSRCAPPVRMGVCNTPLQDGYSRYSPPVRMGVCNTPLQDGYSLRTSGADGRMQYAPARRLFTLRTSGAASGVNFRGGLFASFDVKSLYFLTDHRRRCAVTVCANRLLPPWATRCCPSCRRGRPRY